MNARILFPAVALALTLAATGCNKSGKLNNASAFVPPSGPMELKLKWTPGEHIIQEFNVDQKMVINAPGQRAPMNQQADIDQTLSLKVLSAGADGGHEVEMEFLSTRVNMQIGAQKIKYDTESKEPPTGNNPMAKIFSKLVGVRLDYFLDAGNIVQQIDGIDELADRMAAGGPAGAAFKDMFNEDYFKQMMSTGQLLPTNAVQPGDTWPVHIEASIPMFGKIETDFTMTFKDWELRGKRNCARIDFTGTVNSQPGGKPGPMGITMTIQNGTTDGTLWFDPDFGMATESKMNEASTMVITMPVSTRAPGQRIQSMTNQLTQVIEFKVDSIN